MSERKPLLYTFVGYDRGYLKLLAVFLLSLKQSQISPWAFDLLLIIDPSFEVETYELLDKLQISAKVWCKSTQTIMESSCLRLHIFSWPEITKYSRAIYLDTDILVTAPLTSLFTTPLDKKLYALQQGNIGNTGFGFDFFDFSKISYNTPGINTGTSMFPICQEIHQLFLECLAFIQQHIAAKKPMPPCAEQPFVNYIVVSKNMQSTNIFNGIATAHPEGEKETKALSHFAMPIGDWKSKWTRMIEYISKVSVFPELRAEGQKIAWTKEETCLSFLPNGILQTHWGQGTWTQKGNLLQASWHGFTHYIIFVDQKNYFSFRVKDGVMQAGWIVQ